MENKYQTVNLFHNKFLVQLNLSIIFNKESNSTNFWAIFLFFWLKTVKIKPLMLISIGLDIYDLYENRMQIKKSISF